MAVCYLIWGFQPLYFALDTEIDITFTLACRIIWAGVTCLVILAFQHKLGELAAVFRVRKILIREITAAVLLFADWAIYLFAIRSGKVMQCAMGYYIMPLVMFFFGAVIFREYINRKHFIALAFIVAGIVLSAEGFGGFPAVTISLSLCFAVYSAIKKALNVDSIVSTAAEILILAPFALLYVLFFAKGENALLGVTLARQLFIMGSGIVTGLPLVLFAVGVRYLPLSMTGIMQYVSPTLGIICSLILGESFTKEKLISFVFIWIGVIIYAVNTYSDIRSGERTG